MIGITYQSETLRKKAIYKSPKNNKINDGQAKVGQKVTQVYLLVNVSPICLYVFD